MPIAEGYSYRHLALSHLGLVFVLMLTPSFPGLVMFLYFEFRTSLGTSIIFLLQFLNHPTRVQISCSLSNIPSRDSGVSVVCSTIAGLSPVHPSFYGTQFSFLIRTVYHKPSRPLITQPLRGIWKLGRIKCCKPHQLVGCKVYPNLLP